MGTSKNSNNKWIKTSTSWNYSVGSILAASETFNASPGVEYKVVPAGKAYADDYTESFTKDLV